MNRLTPIVKKELKSYFSSPTAYIFLGAFLLISLFIFFWVEAFFARNIVDVRPLFEWMPVLLIFLVSALTMKSFSDERRMGTLEFLQSTPISTFKLVLGKFFATWILVIIGLLITLVLPIIISSFGDLDWGPILGGYFGSILLAASYISIGLFVSSKTESQIVSLMFTVLIGGIFYLIGAPVLVDYFGYEVAEFLQLFSTGSRFESIARGVIDFRDIYYYLSIIGIFLALNIFSLKKLNIDHKAKRSYFEILQRFYYLIVINLLVANFWLAPLNYFRIDLTNHHLYSLSKPTKALLNQLNEPLFIKGFFSAKTHPLLAPLVPQIRDTLKEYQEFSKDNIRLEFIDPRENEELERQANQKYGIQPIPFQFSDRHQAEIINSYFDIVIEYGDQFEVLSFQDLIEVKQNADQTAEVQLKNLEYDVTRSIKKALYGFQSLDHLFASIEEPLEFVGYISEKDLPDNLLVFKNELNSVLKEYKKIAGDKLKISFLDPSRNPNLAQEILDGYGFQPMATNILSNERFYFYMTLANQNQLASIPLPQDLDAESLKRNFESSFKRLAPGFLKTVGLVTPPPEIPENPYMMRRQAPTRTYQLIEQKLSENYSVKLEDLSAGEVDGEIDLLLVLAPKDLKATEVFAIDQFLMKGGTVILSTSPFIVKPSQTGGIQAEEYYSGLEKWLIHQGILIDDQMILDSKNVNFPITVMRNLGGFKIQEIQLINYPYAIDVRGEGLNQDNPITASLPQFGMYWTSSIQTDAEKNQDRKITPLAFSSKKSWASTSLFVQPDVEEADSGFHPGKNQKQYTLATMVEGKFSSYFAGKKSPLLEMTSDNPEEDQDEKKELISSVIEKSPQSSRIILFASNELLTDFVLNIARAGGTNHFLNNLELVENAVDWSVSDRDLLSIRSRAHFAKTLKPMDREERAFWEYLSYGLVVGLILIVALIYYQIHRSKMKKFTSYRLN